MAHNHALQARMENIQADARARRRHAQVELQRSLAHAKVWWRHVDKRKIAVGAGAVLAAGIGVLWLARKE